MDIGIDLGTTFSVLTVNGKAELTSDSPPGHYLETCDVTVLPTPEGELTFPSIMVENPDQPGQMLFGHPALQRAEEGWPAVMFSKRKMGTKEGFPLYSKTILAKDFAREFLRYLKECAELALGQPVSRAVITHPAYFDRGAVEETREAAHEAGFDMSLNEQMLMEPVSAALTYVRTDPRDPLRILTYDLGGGTFDVTYLERSGGIIDMRSFDGDPLLGGYNFDRELVHWLRKRLEAQGRRIDFNEDDPQDRGRLARLLQLAERVKIALAEKKKESDFVDFRIRDFLIDKAGKAVQVNERITRQEFVTLIHPYLQRINECCRRALEKAGVQTDTVDDILLVGGSSYGPWIADSLHEAFPQTNPTLFHPDLCVGIGAAIHGKMILPKVLSRVNHKLTLDVPEVTVMSTVQVGGQLRGTTGEPIGEGVTASLRLPTGDWLGPSPTDMDGGFIFADVELQYEVENQFRLTFKDINEQIVLEHDFIVVQTLEVADTSTVTTVLPKSLSILTFEGLVPIAKEGASLPAKIAQSFQRDNDNPNLTIELFQERDQVGEIRIEKIPPEGGRGCLVDLEVEITEKNQIRGRAVIRTQDNRVISEFPVNIHFFATEIPTVANLRARCDEYKEEWNSPNEQNELLEVGEHDKISKNFGQVENLFDQQPVDRQEIHALLREVHWLLNPISDDMRPTKLEFCKLMDRCRAELQELIANSQDFRGSETKGEGIEENYVEIAKQNLKWAAHAQETLQTLEHESLEAHRKRDRRSWTRGYDAVITISVRLQDRLQKETAPTSVLKLSLTYHVERAIYELMMKAESLVGTPREQDWYEEINRLHKGLTEINHEVQKVDDNLPRTQGLAQLRRIYSRFLTPLERHIDHIGIDLGKLQQWG